MIIERGFADLSIESSFNIQISVSPSSQLGRLCEVRFPTHVSKSWRTLPATFIRNDDDDDDDENEIQLNTLPKALPTQALTALTSNFGLVGLVQYAW